MSSIRLVRVAKQWGASHALADIDLEVASGTFCVLLGPSGCGKSTTLRIIAGLEAASAGQVLVDGQDVTQLPPSRRGVSMVFQNYALFPHLDVRNNIGFGLGVRKVAADEQKRRIADAAELLGLTPLLGRKPSQLSGGQQQRVALARALVAQSRVCLMDEPLSNLDAQLRQQMRTELRELQKRLGLTVVYVTHDQAEAMSMADQVVLLQGGRIVQAAQPRELYAQPRTTFAASFIGTPAMNLVEVREGRLAGSDVLVPSGAAWLGLRPEAVGLAPAVVSVPSHAHDAGMRGLADVAADSLPAEAPAHVHAHAHAQTVAATVRSTEYLGADLILHCDVASQTLTVRSPGDRHVSAGTPVQLHWPAGAAHWFDAQGQRIPIH